MARARLTCVDLVYHQILPEQPISVEARFARELKTDEERFSRKQKLTEDWVPLETGWVKKASMLVLKNLPEERQTIPTPAEKAEAESHVVEVGIKVMLSQIPSLRDMVADGFNGVPAFLIAPMPEIPPGESCRFRPMDLGAIMVRCRKGECVLGVTVVPE